MATTQRVAKGLTRNLAFSACWLAGCHGSGSGTDAAGNGYSFGGAQAELARIDPTSEKALAVSQILPGETLVSSQSMSLPGIGRPVVIAVVETEFGSRGFGVASDGTTWPTEELRSIEEEAFRVRFGKMSQQLYLAQEFLSPETMIHVNIVVKAAFSPLETADVASAENPTKSDLESRVAMESEDRRWRLIDAKSVVVEILRSAGFVERQQLAGIPIIDIEIPVWFLRSFQFNTLEDIVEVFEDQSARPNQLLGYAAHASMNEAAMTGGLCGGRCDGAGLSVGIWESGCFEYPFDVFTCAGIASQNYRLQNHTMAAYTYENALNSCTTDADCQPGPVELVGAACRKPFSDSLSKYCVFDHPTWVAASLGMVGTYQYNGADSFPIQTGNAPSSVVFQPVGTHNVVYELANHTNQLTSLNWLIDTRPTFLINHSQTGFEGAVGSGMNWAARTRGVIYTQAGATPTQA